MAATTSSILLPATSDNISATCTPPTPVVSPSPRRIRFAPLPDPRRAVLITDDGEEVPLPVPEEDLNHFPASLVLHPTYFAHPLPESIVKSLNHTDERDKELLSASSSSASSSSGSTTGTPRSDSSESPSPISSVGSSPVISTAGLPTVTNDKPPPSWPKPRSLSLLRPFKRSSPTNTLSSSGSSDHSLTPTPSIEPYRPSSSCSASSSSSTRPRKINLFRTSSRESTDSTGTAIPNQNGWSLSRWTSGGSASEMTQLSRTQSTQSTQSYISSSISTSGARAKSIGKKKPRSMSLLFSLASGNGSDTKLASTSSFSFSCSNVMNPAASSSSNVSTSSNNNNGNSKRPTTPTTPTTASRHKGTRMLNGRVYGARRAQGGNNPFASARDEEEEFVEWGYGGMGSVKGARSAGVVNGGSSGDGADAGRRASTGVVDWGRLHGVGSRMPQGVDVDDDGSGMGWVKRRREERERKKREEEEEQAKNQKESVVEETKPLLDKEDPAPIVKSTDEAVQENDEKEERKPGLASHPTHDGPDHIPELVTVPLKPKMRHHHSHGHRHTRSMSGSTVHVQLCLTPSSSYHGNEEEVDEEGVCEKEVEKEGEKEKEVVEAPVERDEKLLSENEDENGDGEDTAANAARRASLLSVSSTSTSSASDSDEEVPRMAVAQPDDDDEEEEEEEEDEAEEERQILDEGKRKTSLGAGVEKVSRHKE